MKQPLKIGVVGAGSLGFHHLRILRDMSEIELVGFVETRESRRADVARELGVTPVDDLDDLLESVDAVTIVVPTPEHFAVAKHALERGRHTFIEKPITATIDEADELLDIADRNGCMVQIGHVERFNRAVRAALPYVSGPRFIESERLAPFNPRGSDVAVVLDLMIHDIDLVLTLVGDTADTITAVGVPLFTPMLDIANARVTFSSGAVANITSSRISRERVRKIRIFQHSGYITLDLAAGTGDFFRLKGKIDPLNPPSGPLEMAALIERIALQAEEGEPLKLEFESFASAIRGDSPIVVTGEEGRRALAVALRIVTEIERTAPALAGELTPARG
ncbi:MAG TPA: Gfo/Idh/MocA family oxidoreductase [Gemmatimonadaceae bacterium]